MGKSVYSIVLSDEVVQEIDDRAYRLGTNRSKLIDRILAERVNCITPEMRMHEIFGLVEQALGSAFLMSPQTSDSVLAVKRALRFKYKPTMKYSVELTRSFSGCVGRLRAGIRTRSEELTALCMGFFEYWSRLERAALGEFFEGGFPCELIQNGYARDFYESGEGELSNREIADAITAYIGALDRGLSLWFENADNTELAKHQAKQIYTAYLSNRKQLL